jgi:uncharacterized protein
VKLIRYALIVCASLLCSKAWAENMRITTGQERGTYIQIGRNLAEWAAPKAGVNLEVMPSAGSVENVKRLRYEPGVRLALVQSDVYQGLLDQAGDGDAEAARLIDPLRVVLPLYDEEIYFVARSDAPFDSVSQIEGKRINVGPLGSGTALSGVTVYRRLFGRPIDNALLSHLSNEEALLKLVTDKSIDVVIVVAGQPARLFSEMKPEAREFIKLLKFDAHSPQARSVLDTYYPATVRKSSYPAWLSEDVPTLSTKAMLVTYNYKTQTTSAALERLTAAMCDQLPALRSSGHAKWTEVKPATPPLGKGWTYFGPTTRALTRCAPPPAAEPAAGTAAAGGECTQLQRALRLCSTNEVATAPGN